MKAGVYGCAVLAMLATACIQPCRGDNTSATLSKGSIPDRSLARMAFRSALLTPLQASSDKIVAANHGRLPGTVIRSTPSGNVATSKHGSGTGATATAKTTGATRLAGFTDVLSRAAGGHPLL